MATASTPRKYAQLKKQVGRKGVQKGTETLAERRVMRHQSMTHSEAQAYIRARTAEGRAVGGYTPSQKQRKAVKVGSGNSDQKPNAARAALKKRMAEQKGNITNKRPPHPSKHNA